MNIKIQTISLNNFKGIKKLEINFDEQLTSILGDNATGKTTIFDAFTWLFFGKDSSDRKDFNIKNTVDLSLNRQEHEVSADVLINGNLTKLRRVYKEKWVKKTGKNVAEFAGHESLFFWDDVPLNLSEWNKKISDTLDEGVFKLISNPFYFNNLKWQERRTALWEVAGEVSYEEIAKGNPEFEALIANLINTKTLTEFKRQLANQKKLIKEELVKIPTRIDEIGRNTPEAVNTALINNKIAVLNKDIADLEQAMTSRTAASENGFKAIQAQQTAIHQLKTKANEIEFEVQQQISKNANGLNANRYPLSAKVESLESEVSQILQQNKRKQGEAFALELKLIELRKQWEVENEKELVFDEHKFTCPTCKRDYESNDVEGMKLEMSENFNNDKSLKLSNIKSQGVAINAEITRIRSTIVLDEINELEEQVVVAKQELLAFDAEIKQPAKNATQILFEHKEYTALQATIKTLTAELPETPKIDLSDLQLKKAEINQIIDAEKALLNNESVINANKTRVSELEAEEQKLANDVAQFEKKEFLIAEFNKAKIETIEARINGLFKLVTFKMYDQLINGEEAETCETMLNGVPYSDLNNAARINAGLDIINTLCAHYKVNAPCFIDNAESITKLIDVQSQIIRLVVAESDKTLRVA